MPRAVRVCSPKCLPSSTPILVINVGTHSTTQSLGEDYVNWPVRWWFSIDQKLETKATEIQVS